MRMIVTSDSHGNKSGFFDVVEKHIDEAELFVNLGDSNSQKDLEDARLYFKIEPCLRCRQLRLEQRFAAYLVYKIRRQKCFYVPRAHLQSKNGPARLPCRGNGVQSGYCAFRSHPLPGLQRDERNIFL